MLRTISLFRTPLRSVPKLSLLPISQSPSPSIQKPLIFKNPNRPYPQIPSSRSLPPFSILSSPFSSSSRRKDDDADDSDGEFILNRDPKSPPKLFVVQPRVRPEARLQVKLAEALNLANSLEEHRDAVLDGELEKREMPPHLVVQNPSARPKSHSETYFGPGTVDTVKCHINAVESKEGVDVVFVNSILSGIQQRNLEREWGRPVLDRVGLIIEIFNAHAQTKEAKLQSELAALMYKRTRLVRVRGPGGRLTFGAAGEAEVVSARGRGSGGRGFISGAGETELQLQRRRIIERRTHLLSQIEEVRRTRALQRASRKRRGGSQGQGLATVAVVGYTNAGKSTLVSALSDADLYSDDRLFATVDPRLRNVILPSGKKVLLSDTVGFISELPIQLVEAFHATLEEVVEADLLVHVLDSSACNVEDQRSSVLQVLQQIGVSSEKLQNMVEVWNKVDLLELEARDDECLREGEVVEDGSLSEAAESEVVSSTPSVSESGDEVTFETCVQETIDCSGHPLNNLRKRVEDLHFEPQNVKRVETLPFEPQDVKRVETLPFEPQDVKRVETSAITGVGLQELLHLIDEKLNVQKPSDEKSYDRKWRPSYATDSEAVVQ